MAAFTASSEPLMEKVSLSKPTSAPEFVQISESIVRMSAGEGALMATACADSGSISHHDAP